MKIEKLKIAAGLNLHCKKCKNEVSTTTVEVGTNILKFTCPSCNKKNKVKFTATAVLYLEK